MAYGSFFYRGILFEISKEGVSIEINRRWLDAHIHLKGMADAVASAERTQKNDKRDVLIWRDPEVGGRAYRLIDKWKAEEEKKLTRRRYLGQGGTHTRAEIRRLWEIQQAKCYYSGVSLGEDFKSSSFSKDHIKSLTSGGNNTIQNIVLCTKSMNSKKGNASLREFLGLYRVSEKQRKIMREVDAMRQNEFGRK